MRTSVSWRCCVTAIASILSLTVEAVLLPSQDPFYTPPGNLNSFVPGQIIARRSINVTLNGINNNSSLPLKVKSAYQYLYRTTDSLGNSAAAVTTLLVPYNADASKLLAYQQAYDSANNNCSPSYALQSGANTTATSDILFITAALDNGWYIVTSDFEGLQAEFTAGVQAGYATLDSVRAAFNDASNTGLSSSARYAMWGYSGGALASEWAAELQPSYAPELKFAGVALGGLTPNVSSVLTTINNSSFSGLAFSGIYGLSKAYPNLTTFVNNNLLPEKSAEFYSIASGCLSQASDAGSDKDIYTYFKAGAELLSSAVPLSVIAAGGQMGTHGVPTAPLFVYKAIGDEVSPVADTDELVSTLCAKGATIEYHRDVIGEHISEAITGSASALSWVADRLNGYPVLNDGCVTELVALSGLTLGTVVELGPDLVAVLQNLLGGDVGPAIAISG